MRTMQSTQREQTITAVIGLGYDEPITEQAVAVAAFIRGEDVLSMVVGSL